MKKFKTYLTIHYSSCETVRTDMLQGISYIKGVVYDTGESLLIFELNSQTNRPLSSVLLQTRTSNAQH